MPVDWKRHGAGTLCALPDQVAAKPRCCRIRLPIKVRSRVQCALRIARTILIRASRGPLPVSRKRPIGDALKVGNLRDRRGTGAAQQHGATRYTGTGSARTGTVLSSEASFASFTNP